VTIQSKLNASSGRRSGQRARKRPAGVPGTAWHFTTDLTYYLSCDRGVRAQAPNAWPRTRTASV